MGSIFPVVKLVAPILAVVAAIVASDEDVVQEELSEGRIDVVSNPLTEIVRWRNHIEQFPRLAPYENSLLQVAERVPFETFSALTPDLQERLAAFAESRLDADMIPASICWAPGAPLEVMSAFHAVEEMTDDAPTDIAAATQFEDGDRWGRNATFRSFFETAVQGRPTTLTWSFIPDGTSIFGFNGEPTSDSDLIAFLDARYGVSDGGSDLTTRPWFSVFEAAFDSIASFTGVTYVYEPNDDGADLTQRSVPSGRLGRRGDVRIGGHFIDGQAGSNTLAYNFSPNAGDMIIDTSNTSYFGNLSSDSLSLRNVVEHESGHGLGLGHVCPINQTKLMEPFISRRFRGLQLDDIFSLNRLYGDFYEKQNSSRNNDSPADASVLPVSLGNTFSKECLSIDDNSDVDFYRINNVPAGAFVSCKVIPTETPSGFVEGPQNTNGSCSTGTPFDFTNVHNLSLDFIASDGSTVLRSANGQPAGQSEEIMAYEAGYSGTLFLRVNGDNTNSTQLYSLEVTIENFTPYEIWAGEEGLPELAASPGDDPDNDGILNAQEYYFGLSPLQPQSRDPISSSVSPDGTRYLFSFNRDPDAQPGEVFFQISDNLLSWSNYFPDPGDISRVPNGPLELVTLSLPATGPGRYLRIAITPSD